MFGAGVAVQVLAMTAGAPRLQPGMVDRLTDRELKVLTLLSEGSSNAQIARTLGLSVKPCRTMSLASSVNSR